MGVEEGVMALADLLEGGSAVEGAAAIGEGAAAAGAADAGAGALGGTFAEGAAGGAAAGAGADAFGAGTNLGLGAAADAGMEGSAAGLTGLYGPSAFDASGDLASGMAGATPAETASLASQGPAAGLTPAEQGLSSADRAALYGDAGYGSTGPSNFMTNTINGAERGAAFGGTKSAIQGQNPITGAVQGGLTGGIAGAGSSGLESLFTPGYASAPSFSTSNGFGNFSSIKDTLSNPFVQGAAAGGNPALGTALQAGTALASGPQGVGSFVGGQVGKQIGGPVGQVLGSFGGGKLGDDYNNGTGLFSGQQQQQPGLFTGQQQQGDVFNQQMGMSGLGTPGGTPNQGGQLPTAAAPTFDSSIYNQPQQGQNQQQIPSNLNQGYGGALMSGLMALYNNNRLGGQINNLQQLYGPNSAYAGQLQQQLDRQAAANGSRSQYGTRAVELQARLADAAARQAPQIAQLSNAQSQNIGTLLNSISRNPAVMNGLGSLYNNYIQPGLTGAWNSMNGGGSTQGSPATPPPLDSSLQGAPAGFNDFLNS